jgi:hypothetical protein
MYGGKTAQGQHRIYCGEVVTNDPGVVDIKIAFFLQAYEW